MQCWLQVGSPRSLLHAESHLADSQSLYTNSIGHAFGGASTFLPSFLPSTVLLLAHLGTDSWAQPYLLFIPSSLCTRDSLAVLLWLLDLPILPLHVRSVTAELWEGHADPDGVSTAAWAGTLSALTRIWPSLTAVLLAKVVELLAQQGTPES